MRKFLFLSLFLFTCVSLIHFLYKIRSGYNIRKISHFKNLDPSELSEQDSLILSQKFTYLSRGRQSFVFVSEDDKYVLKIPRTDHINTPIIAKIFSPLLKKHKTHQVKEVKKNLQSLDIAKSLLVKETALLSIHKGINCPKNFLVKIEDPLGVSQMINLKNMHFAIQRKLPLWADTFLNAKNNNAKDRKELLVKSAIDLFLNRSKKSVANRDKTFDQNFGFENEITYQIDIGDFCLEEDRKDPVNNRRRFLDSLNTLNKWLEKNDPEMIPFLEEQKKKISF